MRQKLLKRLNLALILVSCLFYLLLIHASIQAAARYDQMVQATNEYISCAQADAELAEGSDYLTDQVRMYVSTLEQQYMDNYFIEAEQNRRREHALEQLLAYNHDEVSYDYLREAMENSQILMQREFYAMKLTAIAQGLSQEALPASLQETRLTEEDLALSQAEQLAKAHDLVYGERYSLSKSLITTNVNQSTNSLLLATQQQQQTALHELHSSMQRQCLLISLIFVEVLLFMILYMRRTQKDQKPEQPQD